MKDNKTNIQKHKGSRQADQTAQVKPDEPEKAAAGKGKRNKNMMFIDRTRGADGLRFIGEPEEADMVYPVEGMDGWTVGKLLKAGIRVFLTDARSWVDTKDMKTDADNTGKRDEIGIYIDRTTGANAIDVYREPEETDMAYPVEGMDGWTVGDLMNAGIRVTIVDEESWED